MVEVMLAIGSNLGHRQMAALGAIEEIEALPDTVVVKASHFYRTEPVGPVAQEWYLNACLRIETQLAPQALLDALQGIERRFGRERTKELRWGPRTLDLDILSYGNEIIDTPELTIPHPQLLQRAFVLVPLLDVVAADDPARHSYEAALQQTVTGGVTRL